VASSVVQPIINSNFTMGVQIPKTNFLGDSFWELRDEEWKLFLNYIDNGIIIDPKLITGKQIGPSITNQ
jgi:rod shape-determining protein MreC